MAMTVNTSGKYKMKFVTTVSFEILSVRNVGL